MLKQVAAATGTSATVVGAAAGASAGMIHVSNIGLDPRWSHASKLNSGLQPLATFDVVSFSIVHALNSHSRQHRVLCITNVRRILKYAT